MKDKFESNDDSRAALTFAYRKGAIAATTIASVAFGLKAMHIDDFWCIIAVISLLAAWVVGYGSALAYLLKNSN